MPISLAASSDQAGVTVGKLSKRFRLHPQPGSLTTDNLTEENNMKDSSLRRNLLPTAIVIVFAVTYIMSIATRAQAESPCSYARAVGKYGTSDSGTVVGIGPRAADALWTLDVEGNIGAR